MTMCWHADSQYAAKVKKAMFETATSQDRGVLPALCREDLFDSQGVGGEEDEE